MKDKVSSPPINTPSPSPTSRSRQQRIPKQSLLHSATPSTQKPLQTKSTTSTQPMQKALQKKKPTTLSQLTAQSQSSPAMKKRKVNEIWASPHLNPRNFARAKHSQTEENRNLTIICEQKDAIIDKLTNRLRTMNLENYQSKLGASEFSQDTQEVTQKKIGGDL